MIKLSSILISMSFTLAFGSVSVNYAYAGVSCPNFSGTYVQGRGDWTYKEIIEQQGCRSLNLYMEDPVSPAKKDLILVLKLDDQFHMDYQRDTLTKARWTDGVLYYLQYTDVSRYGRANFEENWLELQQDSIKWTYQYSMSGKVVDRGVSNAAKIK